jgi:hypothetical protein
MIVFPPVAIPVAGGCGGLGHESIGAYEACRDCSAETKGCHHAEVGVQQRTYRRRRTDRFWPRAAPHALDGLPGLGAAKLEHHEEAILAVVADG